MTAPFVIPPLKPADIEDLAPFYFTPIVAPTPVDTRLPVPSNDADTVSGFLRIEAAPSTRFGLAAWDLSFIMHAYSPSESEAADISNKAMAYATAAGGQTVMGWYIITVVSVVGGSRLSDPNVPLPRYRSAVTWRVAGRPYN